MMKIYQAKSQISISLLLKSGKSIHIAFSPLTGGGSRYYTSDVDIQKALEKHPKFGKLFKCLSSESVEEGEEDLSPIINDNPTGENQIGDSLNLETTQKPLFENISVACLEDAKEYLAEKFGISRSKLRSKPSIENIAKDHGIVFVGM